MSAHHLDSIGVYGYGDVEPVILAALVSGDPLLLIGRSGTGKTYLLNSLSEALHLEHRHYNASLISFDDLVGFPWPEPDGTAIRFIETPATVWKAESVLVDEINRCKPEHQNRLFSLVHERRIQGVRLENLRYRWAAMNPVTADQDDESYAGCEPLDPALADRFAFLVGVADWGDLGPEDRARVADPRGDGAISIDTTGLLECVGSGREAFEKKLRAPDPLVTGYCCHAATALGEGGLRISPRRVRQLARNILALESVSRLPRERLFKLALQWSLPQRGGLTHPDDAVVQAAHRTAWEAVCSEGEERWLFDFHTEPDLAKRIALLFETCSCADTGSIAVAQLIASETAARAAAFAFAVYPALLGHPKPPIGQEGFNEVGKLANEILDVKAKVEWRDGSKEPYKSPDGGKYRGVHPAFRSAGQHLATLKGRRQRRAEQVFLYLLAKGQLPDEPAEYERLVHRCVAAASKHHGTATA